MAFMLQNKESVVALVSGLTDPEERSSWSQPLNHHRKGRHTPPFTFFLVQTIGNTATRGLIRAHEILVAALVLWRYGYLARRFGI
jgi:hypothetical protein